MFGLVPFSLKGWLSTSPMRDFRLPPRSRWHMRYDTCSVPGYYAACSGNSLQTFWDNLAFILDFLILENMRPKGCFETSVMNYNYTLRNNPEERISYTAFPFNSSNIAVESPVLALPFVSWRYPGSNPAWGSPNLSEDCCSPSTPSGRGGAWEEASHYCMQVLPKHHSFSKQSASELL